MKFPGLFYSTEEASAKNQKKFLIARGSEFVLFTMAAFFGEFPSNSFWHLGPVFTFSFFLTALIIRLSGIGDASEKLWYDARAAAESIKSSAWQYAVCGEAFRKGDIQASIRFIDSLKKILETLPKLDIAAPDESFAITSDMDNIRNSTKSYRAKKYIKERVEDQASWYAKKAQWNKRRSKWWRWILITVESSAVILGGLRMLDVFDVNGLSIFAAIAAGIVAWQQTKNYSSLSESYAVTSHEVAIVKFTLKVNVREDIWAQSVHDAEAAFSREHTLWLARRQGPKRAI